MSRYRRIALVACTLIVASCLAAFARATVQLGEYRQRLSADLDGIDAGDGIDSDESQRIATVYFLAFVSGCGGPKPGKLVGEEWVIPASRGYAGKPMSLPIRVNAGNGAVHHAAGLAFSSYRTFRFMVLWGQPVYRLMEAMREWPDEAVMDDF